MATHPAGPSSSKALMMRTAGVLGGVGPPSTAALYLQVMQELFAVTNRRPPMVIWSLPADLTLQSEFISSGTGISRYIDDMVEGAQRLRGAGVDFLVLPCCSLQPVLGQIQSRVGMPIISLAEEVAVATEARMVRRVGLLGSRSTLQSGIFAEELRTRCIECVEPQASTTDWICGLIVRAAMGRCTKLDGDALEVCIANWQVESHLDAVVIACTDLSPLALPMAESHFIIDSLTVLANATCREILGDASAIANVVTATG